MAKPTLWTQELQEKIAARVKSGVRAEVAAGAEGIGRSTYFEWMQRNDGFRTAITRARDEWEAEATESVLRGDDVGVGFGPAKATLEVLSRRLPKQWSQKFTHEINDMTARVLEVVRRVCSEADYIRCLEELSREDSEGGTPEHPGESAGPVH